MKRFGETLGLAVETSKVVPDGTVSALNQMRLRLSHCVRLRHTKMLERNIVTTVSIRVNVPYVRSDSLDFSVYLTGC